MALPFGSAIAAFPQYRFTDLRPLMQSAGSFTGINNNGDIAGQIGYNDRVYLQLYRSGVYSLVAPPVQSASIQVHFYNDSGIVGGTTGHYATFWNEQTGWTLLPRAGSMSGGIGDTSWIAEDYNESLQTIAGYAEVRTTSNQFAPIGCRWDQVNGEWVRIMSPTVGTNRMDWCTAVLNNGDIVGFGYVTNDISHEKVMYWSKSLNTLSLLGYPSSGWSVGGNIEADRNGRIIAAGGRGTVGAFEGAVFSWNGVNSSPEMFTLNILPGYGIQDAQVNRNGLVAARTVNDTTANGVGVLWSRENGFARIDSLFESGTQPVSIRYILDLNDNGSILVAAYRPGEGEFMARLDPVPEPTSLLLLTPGLAWVVMRRKKRKAAPPESRS